MPAKKHTKKTVKSVVSKTHKSGYPYTTVLLFQTLIITIVGTIAMLSVLNAWRIKEKADNEMLTELRQSVTQLQKANDTVKTPMVTVTKTPVRR